MGFSRLGCFGEGVTRLTLAGLPTDKSKSMADVKSLDSSSALLASRDENPMDTSVVTSDDLTRFLVGEVVPASSCRLMDAAGWSASSFTSNELWAASESKSIDLYF